jgi:ABC-type multidrug transport system fused ATPase/permease subunit
MDKSKITWDIVKSTSIVFLTSSLIALTSFLFGINWAATFILAFVLQYILFSFFGNIINNYFVEKTKQMQLNTLEPLSTILECAYCNSKNIMTFLADENERMEFECTSCKNKNLVNIQFVVARITDAVTINNVTNIPLIDENDES